MGADLSCCTSVLESQLFFPRISYHITGVWSHLHFVLAGVELNTIQSNETGPVEEAIVGGSSCGGVGGVGGGGGSYVADTVC